MSTETKEPPAIPKRHAEWLTKGAEEFDRIMKDATTLQCFTRYCFALLDKLDVRRHWLRENVHPESVLLDKDLPTADHEEQLLQRFADTVRERHPRLYAVCEDNILGDLRRLCCDWLSQFAGYDESQTLLNNAFKAIPRQLTRDWDNPVRVGSGKIVRV